MIARKQIAHCLRKVVYVQVLAAEILQLAAYSQAQSVTYLIHFDIFKSLCVCFFLYLLNNRANIILLFLVGAAVNFFYYF